MLWIWTAIIPTLLGFYVLVGIAVGKLGGWTRLGYSYQSHEVPIGTCFRFQSVDFRWLIGYGGCVRSTVTSGGLHLAAPIIFRIGHPSLLFPWEQIAAKSIKVLGMDYVELRFQEQPDLMIRIRRWLADKIQAGGGKLDWTSGQTPNWL